jgi:hypothetical protein
MTLRRHSVLDLLNRPFPNAEQLRDLADPRALGDLDFGRCSRSSDSDEANPSPRGSSQGPIDAPQIVARWDAATTAIV